MHLPATSLLLSVCALAAAEPLGCRPPDATERAWMDEHLVIADQVHLNRTAIARINAERTADGLAALALAPAADDAEVSGRTAAQRAAGVAAAPAAKAAPAPLPAVVDNAALDAFPPVASQGSLGSCACFSTTYYTMTYMVARARGVNAKTGGSGTRYSTKFCYNLINGGADGGSWITNAFAVQQAHGAPTLAAWPYDSDYRAWPTTAAVWRGALPARMGVSGSISGVSTDSGLANLKRMLANGYVLNYATDIYGWQFTTVANDPATTADDAFAGQQVCHWYRVDDSGHGMTVVGYNDHLWVDLNGNGTVDSGEKGALKIVNSWGSGWRNGGFAWILYDALKATSAVPGWSGGTDRTGALWYDSAYWITARPAHQPTVLAEFTLNSAKRAQLQVQVGVSATTQTSPSQLLTSKLSSAGGAYAFNGTTTAGDGTFVLDVSDALPAGTSRCYLRVRDSTAADPCQVLGCTFTDGAGALLAAAAATDPAGGLPASADAGTILAWADLTITDTTAPGAITDLAATYATPTAITLAWTAPGDDGGSGTAKTYDVRYAAAPITALNWALATQAAGEPAPKASGGPETFQLAGLTAGTSWYIAIAASDEAGNVGAISNLVAEATPAVLAITGPAPLPDADLGPAYAATLTAAGGTGARTWTAFTGHAERDPGTAAIAAVGTARGWKADSGSWTYAFPAGFAFPFAGADRTSVRVSSDGYLEFGSAVTATYGNDTALKAAAMIAPCWYDLSTAGTAQPAEDIYIAEEADAVTIRWVAEYNSGHGLVIPVDAQATLHRDGRIAMAWARSAAISPYVGVSDGDGVHWTRSDRAWQQPVAGTRRDWDLLTWPAGLTLDAATGALGGVLAAPGRHRLGIRVADSGYPAQTASASLDLAVGIPAITSATSASGMTATPFSYQIIASNAPASFTASGLPAGLTCDASGLISGTPALAGTTLVAIAAGNAGGTGTAMLTIAIAQHPPVITSASSASGAAGMPFSYQITADHLPTAFAASGLPAGLACDAAGLISGVPAAPATTTVTISASNAGGPGSAPLVLGIGLVAPTITSAPTATGAVGQVFSYQITAIGAATAFAAAGLPPSLACDATGRISGTPTAAGTAAVTLTASNAAGAGTSPLALSVSTAADDGGAGDGGGSGGGGCGAGGLAGLLLAGLALGLGGRRRG